MPLAQYDYDYYEYGRTRRGTGNTAPRVSDVRNTRNSAIRARAEEPTRTRRTSQRQVASTNNTARRKTSTTSNAATRNTRNTVQKTPTRTTKTVQRTSTKRNEEELITRRKSQRSIEVNVYNQKRQIAKPKEMSLKNAQVISKPKAKTKENTFKKVAFSFFAFSVLFLICYRSSVINESFSELSTMKSELSNVQNTNAQLSAEIQTQTDLSFIESYAKYQLGMQKPKESQIQKVLVEKEDKIATPVVVEEEKEKTFLEALINDIANILD